MSKSSQASAGARTRARELMVQALYQKQIAGHTTAELVAQFREDTAYARVDQAFFDEMFPAISDGQEHIEKKIDSLIDRPLAQLDPIELSILLIGVHEFGDSHLLDLAGTGGPLAGRFRLAQNRQQQGPQVVRHRPSFIR